MYYEIFEKLCKEKGVRPADVAKATKISTATLTSWKQGKYTPKSDKLQKIADYFEVPLEAFTSNKTPKAVFHVHNSSRPPHLEFDKSKILEEVSAVLDKTIPEMQGYPVYYSNPETASVAQKLFDDPNYRVLFDAACDSKPEDLLLAAELLKRLKETNPNG